MRVGDVEVLPPPKAESPQAAMVPLLSIAAKALAVGTMSCQPELPGLPAVGAVAVEPQVMMEPLLSRPANAPKELVLAW